MAASRGLIPDDAAIVELVGPALLHDWRQRSTERPVARALVAPAEHPEIANCRHQRTTPRGGGALWTTGRNIADPGWMGTL
jgi:hypothetical protein